LQGSPPTGKWTFDPYDTQVEFSAKHLGMMSVRGHFAEVTATSEIHPEKPELSTIEATISTASIRTHNDKFEMMLDGKFIVNNEIKINVEGELVEGKESETAGSARLSHVGDSGTRS
jgi:polyisoprenoid-binding protein YceI